MSQFFIATTSGNLPPSVATSYVTDSGTAIPAANVLNVNGATAAINNTNGVQTLANPNGSNNLVIELTNRIVATAKTTDGVTPVQVYSFPLGATPGAYLFFTRLIAYDQTSNQGAGYSSYRSVRTDGTTATLIGADTGFIEEELDLREVNAVNSVVGNNQVLTVTGVTGHTVNWQVLVEFVFVVGNI